MLDVLLITAGMLSLLAFGLMMEGVLGRDPRTQRSARGRRRIRLARTR